MIRRAFTSGLLALCLTLTSLAGVVMQTRMAAAGEFCGTGTPSILLDGAGLPVLDRNGHAVEAPECPACNLNMALPVPVPPGPALPTDLSAITAPILHILPAPERVRLDAQPRAPPRVT